jgi:alkylhydroperoxidase family enzyme
MKAPRIAPLDPPYSPDVAELLGKWMPPGSGLDPLALFRVLAVHPSLSSRMRATGAGILGDGLVPARERELMILRTSALCGAEYEWGVHAAAFGPGVGLDASDALGVASGDFERFGLRDQLVLRLADALHETSSVPDLLWRELSAEWSSAQLLELIVTAGWYHAIAFVINASGIEPEPWALRLDQAAA